MGTPPFVLPPFANDSPSDYLYERKGPWPQPSPGHPLGEAAAVLHLPREEIQDWNEFIGSRYALTLLTYWPQALSYAFGHRGVQEVPLAEFSSLLSDGVLSRFMTDTLDAVDQTLFATQIAAAPAGSVFYKVDFSAIGYVMPFPGMYITPTITLMQKDSTGVHAVAIAINNLVLTPTDVNAWRLAQAYVLQGSVHRLIISLHPVLHFPLDSVNAITKSSVPMNHVLFKLLAPHLRFSLVLNNTVLENYFSILNNFWFLIYGCFAGPTAGLRELIVAGYHGIPGNSAYPEYTWKLQKPVIHSNYGVFLDKYWDTIHKFVSGVVANIPANEHDHIKRWAQYISQEIDLFPDGSTIMTGTVLQDTLTTIIWDISVAHAADHWNYSEIPINKVPTRLRVPPPTSPNIQVPAASTWSTLMDVFKYKMAWKMFFRPANVTMLEDTNYGFGNPALDALNVQFLQDLRNTDANMPVTRYIPLNQIARGIQY